MTKTFKELQSVDELIGNLYQKDAKLKDTKFGYAYKIFSEKNYVPVIKEFQEALASIRINNALEDKNTKEILVDRANPRGYKYSKEGLNACIAQERKIEKEFDEKVIEITPYFCKVLPELTEEQVEQLKGLIIE